MSKTLINIALDLETLSTREDAAIIQIGCCIPNFDRIYIPEGISHEFETTISYSDTRNNGYHIDEETMQWWDKQDQKVRAQVFSGQNSYDEAFHQFAFWIQSLKTNGADVAVWGNGSDFDNRILTYSLDSYGYHGVWNFRNNRDLRTLKAIFPFTLDPLPDEVKHTALGDARYEARLIDAIHTTYLYAGEAL